MLVRAASTLAGRASTAASHPSRVALARASQALGRVSHFRRVLAAPAPTPARTSLLSTAAAMGFSTDFTPKGISVDVIPVLNDNYVFLVHEPQSGVTACVDPADPAPVLAKLKEKGLTLDYVINTHHHWDHVGGNMELKEKGGPNVKIVGAACDQDRIPGIDIKLSDGDTWSLGSQEVRVYETPGHTRGHVCYYLPGAEVLFSGDTLFSMGCGRLFEGSPQEMWASLSKLRELPGSTGIYCAHEYTQSNAKFAMSVDGGNPALQKRSAEVDTMRSQGISTVPTRMDVELDTNPFLRPFDEGLRKGVGKGMDASDDEAFAAVRKAKDKF